MNANEKFALAVALANGNRNYIRETFDEIFTKHGLNLKWPKDENFKSRWSLLFKLYAKNGDNKEIKNTLEDIELAVLEKIAPFATFTPVTC